MGGPAAGTAAARAVPGRRRVCAGRRRSRQDRRGDADSRPQPRLPPWMSRNNAVAWAHAVAAVAGGTGGGEGAAPAQRRRPAVSAAVLAACTSRGPRGRQGVRARGCRGWGSGSLRQWCAAGGGGGGCCSRAARAARGAGRGCAGAMRRTLRHLSPMPVRQAPLTPAGVAETPRAFVEHSVVCCCRRCEWRPLCGGGRRTLSSSCRLSRSLSCCSALTTRRAAAMATGDQRECVCVFCCE